PSFYAALYDRTLEKHPKAVVTEYAWDARSCDPCPLPPLTPQDLATLGADVLPSSAGGGMSAGFVLTRLHARYSKDALGEDLVFKAADAIAGGREFMSEQGKLERGFVKWQVNNFQARYAIRHPWKGPVACASPRRGIWGGPWASVKQDTSVKAATGLAFAPRG